MSSPTYPLPTLAAQITAAGISAPSFEDLYNSEVATEQSIFGADIVLAPDTQDGQRLAIRCTAINDLNQLAIAVYLSFLATYAQGAGLSALAQLIGIQRKASSNSTVPVIIGGQSGTIIQGGVVVDRYNGLWNLPALVEIPDAGTIAVTATAQQQGAITIQPGDIVNPWTIIPGWQTASNTVASTPGLAIETDAALRQRIILSTALTAETPLSTIVSAVAELAGVGRILGYENNTRITDGNGIPGNSVAIVVEGGDVTQIAQTIEAKKAPGTGTYGTTTVPVTDPEGMPISISFFALADTQIYFSIQITALFGYVSTTADAIKAALVTFLNSLGIGKKVYLNQLLGVASLASSPLGLTFVVTSMLIGTSPGQLSAADIPIGFTAAASCQLTNIAIVAQ
ncbi:hypothetical protein DYQ86_15990 [Acidobacteria bacterium AB60]|nr:hypothetical protein DYQ86_15990 [Acidobacteria bacterium AB60]